MNLVRKDALKPLLPNRDFKAKTVGHPKRYVDKTAIIAELINDDGCYCLCRPRRFGKTLTASIIADIFANGLTHFQDCAIAQDNLWQDKQYPVLFISFNNVALSNKDELTISLKNKLQYFAQTNHLEINLENLPLTEALFNILNHQALEELVIIIDEYDLPLINSLDRFNYSSEIVDVLASFYGAIKAFEAKIRFMLLTGVNRVSNLSIFSGLNNIKDISLEPQYATIVGYTEQELLDNFAEPLQQIADYYELSFTEFIEQLRLKYNGYCFDQELKTTVFNTWDINNLLTSTISSFSQDCFLPSYWAMTGSVSHFVMQYFACNKQKLLEFLEVVTTSLPYVNLQDILGAKNFQQIPAYIFMFNAGYLTLSATEADADKQYILNFPNQAIAHFVLDELIDAVSSFFIDKGQELFCGTQGVLDLLDVHRSSKKHQEQLTQLIVSSGIIPSDCFSRESQLRTLLIIMFKAVGLNVQFEVSKINGRADLLVIHKNIAYIFELKVFHSAQIKAMPTPQDIAQASYKKKVEAFKQIASKSYKYIVPPTCHNCYFAVIVGDCSSGEITDFEYLDMAGLAVFFKEHEQDKLNKVMLKKGTVQ